MLTIKQGNILVRDEFDRFISSFTMSQQTPPTLETPDSEPETLGDLFDFAEDFAHNCLQKTKMLPSALFYIGQDNEGVFVPRPSCDVYMAEQELYDNMRLIAIHSAATSCVTLRMLKIASEHNGASLDSTEYCLQLYGESGSVMVLKCLAAIHDIEGRYLRLDDSSVRTIHETERVFRMLPRGVPSVDIRAEAAEKLRRRGVFEPDFLSLLAAIRTDV